MNSEADVSSRAEFTQSHLKQAYIYYEETEEFDKALQECEVALELDPYLADAHNLRGVILEELGAPFGALKAYRQALQLDPDFAEAKENLAALKAEFGSEQRLVTIATFSYPTEAYVFKSKLEAAGIWSFVADEGTVTMNWLYSNAIGGVKLKVRETDVEPALEVLAEEPEQIELADEEIEDEEQETRCPRCQSANTYYERYATRLVFLSWLLLTFPLPFLKRKWKCQDCGHQWN